MPFSMDDWTPAASMGGGTENVWNDGDGLHITQTKEGEAVSGGNILATSDGLHVRDGEDDLLKAASDGVTVGKRGEGRVKTVPDGIEFYVPQVAAAVAKLLYDEHLGIVQMKGARTSLSADNESRVSAHNETGRNYGEASAAAAAYPGARSGEASLFAAGGTYSGAKFSKRLSVRAGDLGTGVYVDDDRLAAFPCEVVDSGMWSGYKFSNGQAVIWGRKGFDMSSTGEWGALYYGDVPAVDYPFAFAGQPYELTDILGSRYYWLASNAECTKTRTGTYYNVSPSRHATATRCWVTYIVCGRWK